MTSFIRIVKQFPEDQQKNLMDSRISRLEKMRDDYMLQTGIIIKDMKKMNNRSLKNKLLIKNNIIILSMMTKKVDNTLDILYEYYSQLYEQDELLDDECCTNCNNGDICAYEYGDYWD